MTKIMTAADAAKKTFEAQAQYCTAEAYEEFMNMLADEIKVAINNGWTSTTPVRWGYLPDGWQNKAIDELSLLGYSITTVEDKLIVSWYDHMTEAEREIKAAASASQEEQHLWAIFYDRINYRSKKVIKRIYVVNNNDVNAIVGEIVISYAPKNIKAIPIKDIKQARDTWTANGYKPYDDDDAIWEKEE